MPEYRLHAVVTAAKVSDLPWPDADERIHIEYTVSGVDDVGDPHLAYEISLSYPRTAELVNGQPVADWLASYAVGKNAYLILDDEDEPTDLQFVEPMFN